MYQYLITYPYEEISTITGIMDVISFKNSFSK